MLRKKGINLWQKIIVNDPPNPDIVNLLDENERLVNKFKKKKLRKLDIELKKYDRNDDSIENSIGLMIDKNKQSEKKNEKNDETNNDILSYEFHKKDVPVTDFFDNNQDIVDNDQDSEYLSILDFMIGFEEQVKL